MTLKYFLVQTIDLFVAQTGDHPHLVMMGWEAFQQLRTEMQDQSNSPYIYLNGVTVSLRPISRDSIEFEWDHSTPTSAYTYTGVLQGNVTLAQVIALYISKANKPGTPAPAPYIQQLGNHLKGAYVAQITGLYPISYPGLLYSSDLEDAHKKDPVGCPHEFQRYNGFTESYDFCTLCNQKKDLA